MCVILLSALMSFSKIMRGHRPGLLASGMKFLDKRQLINGNDYIRH